MLTRLLSRLAEEHCFALNSASLIDNALALTQIGGTYANTRPCEFICLALKLLQLQPEREIILEYLRAEEFKCVPPLLPPCMQRDIAARAASAPRHRY